VVDVLLEVSVRAPPVAEAEDVRREEDVMVRGATAAEEEGEALVGGAEAVRPMIGGAAGCGELAALGFCEGCLSQDEKKSSSSPTTPGCAEGLEVSTPSTTMPFGNLRHDVWTLVEAR